MTEPVQLKPLSELIEELRPLYPEAFAKAEAEWKALMKRLVGTPIKED